MSVLTNRKNQIVIYALDDLSSIVTFHSDAAGGEVNEMDALVRSVAATHSDVATFRFSAAIGSEPITAIASGSPTVSKAELQFSYFEADANGSVNTLEFVPMLTDPSTIGATSIFADVSGTTGTYGSKSIRGDEKTLTSIELNARARAELGSAFASGSIGHFSIGVRRGTLTGTGQVNVGGRAQSRGIDTLWQNATGIATEIFGPPVLIITTSKAASGDIVHTLRYTTADPTTNQNSPSSSIGGFMAPNNVYSDAQIGAGVGSTDTTVQIASGDILPTVVGLAQLGPEIFDFAGVDTTNEQLTGITRGISPPVAFPSFATPFPEDIRYLEIDKLFDTTPTEASSQYRCVAVRQDVTDAALFATSVIFSLVQNPSSDVQVDIGLELPRHDSHTGTLFATADVSDITFASTDTEDIIGLSSGLFNGSHIRIDNSFNTIIDSYDVVGSTGTFIVDDGMPAGGFDPGTSYVISPAPAQTVTNETVAPTENNGRFLGFFGNGGERTIDIGSIRERDDRLNDNDLIYIWIKRTLKQNAKPKANTGAIILMQFVRNG